jgi:hypothetical protein
MIVRFEDLVQNTEATMRAVCRFLDEDYTPAMLAMAGSPGHRSKVLQGAESTGGAVALSPGFIGRYRGKISQEEIAFMQAYAGRQMAAFGYRREPLSFSPVEWARYTLTSHPANLFRMTIWLTREALQQRFPGRARRRPSQAMLLPSGAGHTGIQSKSS